MLAMGMGPSFFNRWIRRCFSDAGQSALHFPGWTCHPPNSARIFVTYAGTTGHIVRLRFENSYFTGRPVTSCIERAVRDQPIGPFRATRWSTSYEFAVR